MHRLVLHLHPRRGDGPHTLKKLRTLHRKLAICVLGGSGKVEMQRERIAAWSAVVLICAVTLVSGRAQA
jgi:hypothetical protein